jgi:hypothetical protein
MSRRFTNTYQAVNLVRNGNLDMIEALEDQTQTAPFWSTDLVHVAAQDSVVANLYEIFQGDPGDAPAQGFRVKLVTNQASLLYQDMRRDPEAHVMDFPVPLAAGLRSTIAQGYQATETQSLPSAGYTLAFTMRVTQGTVTASVASWDYAGARTTPTLLTGTDPVVVKTGGWERHVLPFSVDKGLGQVGLELQRAANTDLAVVEIGLVALALGRYRSLPYTGDPLVSALPKGAIILSLGTVCPPGFEELGEGDLTPLSEWSGDEPGIKARKGNYPRSGTALTGTTSHTVDTLELTPGAKDVSLFSGPDSKAADDDALVSTTKSNPAVDEPGGKNGTPNHDHSLETAGTRPVSRAFLFCRRI